LPIKAESDGGPDQDSSHSPPSAAPTPTGSIASPQPQHQYQPESVKTMMNMYLHDQPAAQHYATLHGVDAATAAAAMSIHLQHMPPQSM
jgi:hypothetical protein